MKAEVIHVSDHAMLRWGERVQTEGLFTEEDIRQAVLDSKLIKKDEPLPYLYPRRENTVYSIKDKVLFVLKPLDVGKFRVLTVLTEFNPSIITQKIFNGDRKFNFSQLGRSVAYRERPIKKLTIPSPPKMIKVAEGSTPCEVYRPVEVVEPMVGEITRQLDDPAEFSSELARRKWLLELKEKIEKRMGALPKHDSRRHQLCPVQTRLSRLLIENKEAVKQQNREMNPAVNYGIMLSEILSELRELRAVVEELRGSQATRPGNGPVHVQPLVTREPNLVAGRHGSVQLTFGGHPFDHQ